MALFEQHHILVITFCHFEPALFAGEKSAVGRTKADFSRDKPSPLAFHCQLFLILFLVRQMLLWIDSEFAPVAFLTASDAGM